MCVRVWITSQTRHLICGGYMRQEKTVKPQNPKRDESGTGRDESGKSRDESADRWDESAARAGRQRAGGGPCWARETRSIRQDDARDGPRIDTISRMSESCSPSGSLPSTSAPMPTQFSTHAEPHRRQCGTGTFSSIALSSLVLSSIYLWDTPRGSMVASVADRASHRAKTVTSQEDFQARAATSLPTTTAAVSSYPWLSLRATRSKGYASGLPVGACRLIGRACIRGRKG